VVGGGWTGVRWLIGGCGDLDRLDMSRGVRRGL